MRTVTYNSSRLRGIRVYREIERDFAIGDTPPIGDLKNHAKREFDPFFDWLMGKWFGGSAPLGPEIVTAEEGDDPHKLAS
jgi:hypothetical protein